MNAPPSGSASYAARMRCIFFSRFQSCRISPIVTTSAGGIGSAKKSRSTARYTIGDTGSRKGAFGDRTHGGEVAAGTTQVGVALRGDGRQQSGCAANVGERRIAAEVELLCEELEVSGGNACHRVHELLEARRVRVELVEHRPAGHLDLVLGGAGPQGFGEIGPEGVEARVGHLEDAADIGRLVPVQEHRAVRGVGVDRVGAVSRSLEEAERDETVEEVATPSRAQTEPLAETIGAVGLRSEFAEHAELDATQQSLRREEPHSHLHDVLRIIHDTSSSAASTGPGARTVALWGRQCRYEKASGDAHAAELDHGRLGGTRTVMVTRDARGLGKAEFARQSRTPTAWPTPSRSRSKSIVRESGARARRPRLWLRAFWLSGRLRGIGLSGRSEGTVMAPVEVSSGTRDRVWVPGALLCARGDRLVVVGAHDLGDVGWHDDGRSRGVGVGGRFLGGMGRDDGCHDVPCDHPGCAPIRSGGGPEPSPRFRLRRRLPARVDRARDPRVPRGRRLRVRSVTVRRGLRGSLARCSWSLRLTS